MVRMIGVACCVVLWGLVGAAAMPPVKLRAVLADMERKEPVLVVFFHPDLPLWNAARPVLESVAGEVKGMRVLFEDVRATPEHVQYYALREYPTLRMYPALQGALVPVEIPFERSKVAADYLKDLAQVSLLVRDVHGDAGTAVERLVPLLRALDPGALAAYEQTFEASERRAAWEAKLEGVASGTTRADGNASFLLSEDDVHIDHVPARLRQHLLETQLEHVEAALSSSLQLLQLRQRRLDLLLALLRSVRTHHDPRILVREHASRMRSLLHAGLLHGQSNDELRRLLILEISTIQPLLDALQPPTE
jgi:hypothetical protein